MQTIRILFCGSLCAFAAFAQGVINGDRQYLGKVDSSTATLTAPLRILSSEPATCDATKHEIYYNAALTKARICNTANTWSDFTGSLTIPPPGPSSLGGVDSKDCSALGANYMVQKVNTDGSITCSPTSGGGGASSQSQLTDFQITIGGSGTTLNNVSCSVGTPCGFRVNELPGAPFTGQPYSCTYNPANGTSGDIFVYLDKSGNWVFLYGNGTLTSGALTCGTGWTATYQASISSFPSNTCGLYHFPVVSSVIQAATVDNHGVACNIDALTSGAGITITGSGASRQITSTATGGSSAGTAGTFQQSDGSGGFAASNCQDAFGVTTCSHAIQDTSAFAAQLNRGFGITTCATTATVQAGGYQLVNVTGACTLSLANAGTDGTMLYLIVCENATGGFAITYPANLIGIGTPVTTANKCNAQWFIGSTSSSSIGGHTLNASWLAVSPMVSY